MFMKKALPIGYENYKEIISKELYYVDNTLLIKDILDIPIQTRNSRNRYFTYRFIPQSAW